VTPKCTRPKSTEHPVALGSFSSWVRLLRENPWVERPFFPRAVFVTLTTLLTVPLRVWERLRYGRRIRRTPVDPQPIFILGHWRSGTTHLHNLLSRDPAVGFLSTFQAMAPGFCLSGDRRIKPLLARQAAKRYPTRLIDNVPLAFDAPQEDEFALASMSPYSFLHGFTFPRRAQWFFNRYVLFRELSNETLAHWCSIYQEILRKAAAKSQRQRLVLKNCAHSGRIKTLLKLFPEAKFIHIHRDPYEVFVSTVHMHRTVLPKAQLQRIAPEEVPSNVLLFYRELMQRLLEDRASIPADQYVEIRFEDLESAPLPQLERIYRKLHLPGFESARPHFEQYIDSVSAYRKNEYHLAGEMIETINRQWAFAFSAWGYTLRDPSCGGST
jgi:omega-hydroxy-beta-dihydromenaquinone-9 sulfotransferase